MGAVAASFALALARTYPVAATYAVAKCMRIAVDMLRKCLPVEIKSMPAVLAARCDVPMG